MRPWLPAALALKAACVNAAHLTYEGGQRQAYALNDFTRPGQTFTVDTPCNIVVVDAPGWNDNEGGSTLSLYDSPLREKLHPLSTFEDVGDDSRLYLFSTTQLQPGAQPDGAQLGHRLAPDSGNPRHQIAARVLSLRARKPLAPQ